MTIVKLSKAFVTTGLDLGNSLQLIFAVLLLILGVLVAIQGIKKLLEKPETEKKAERAISKKTDPYAVCKMYCVGDLLYDGVILIMPVLLSFQFPLK